GDTIILDITAKELQLAVSEDELAKRKKEWQPRPPNITTGYAARYARQVSSGSTGAVVK
ncbi:MAG: dihydroxy-acid dehydratase, partial [Desulfobulbaceae bacterium]|nr:dihydroxy-acid dehydratase [Desulfobulbaceae bacterium]